MKKLILIIIALICCYNYSAMAEFEYFGPPGEVNNIVSYKGELYASGGTHIYKSTNDGILWTKLDSYKNYYNIISIYVSDELQLISTEKDVYISTNRGDSWELLLYGAISSYYKDGDTLYGTLFGQEYYHYLFFSSNGGETWCQGQNNLDYKTGINKLCKLDGIMFAASTAGVLTCTDACVTWSPSSVSIAKIKFQDLCTNTGILYASSDSSGIYISSDKGKTWKQSNEGLTEIKKLKICVSGDKIFAASPNKGLFVSSDKGATWNTVNTGIHNPHLTCITSAGNNIYVSTTTCIFKSNDNGATWMQINDGIACATQGLLTVENDNLYLANSESVFKSTNNGKHWKELLFNEPSNFAPYTSAFMKSDKNIYVCYPNKLFLSTDEGNTWSNNKTAGIGTNNSIISFTHINKNLLAGTKNGGIYVSSDNGVNWTPSNTGYKDSSASMLGMYKSTIYAKGESFVYWSIDNGVTWQAQNTWPANINTFHFTGEKMLIGAATGLYLSTDLGATWNSISTQPNVNSIFASGDTTYFTANGNLFLSFTNNYQWDYISDYSNSFYSVYANSDYTIVSAFSGVGVIKSNFDLKPPKLVSPMNNADNVNYIQNFSWMTVSNVDYYRLQIAKDSNFTSLVADYKATTKNVDFQLFLYATNYYWRVQSIKNNDSSAWSEIRHFKTNGSKGPTLNSPRNNSIDVNAESTTLKWERMWNAGVYTTQMSMDSTFKKIQFETSTYDPEITYENLLNNTKYFWRVSFRFEANYSPWSKVYSFITNKLVPPKLGSPNKNDTNMYTTLVLSWWNENRVDSVRIQLSTDTSFKTLIIDTTFNETQYYLTGLAYNTKYFFRGKSFKKKEESDWGTPSAFTTFELKAPTQEYPHKSDTNLISKIALQWSYSREVEKFRCQIALDSSFKQIVCDNSYTTRYSYLYSLKNNTKYYWRVNAVHNGNTSPWSEAWSFTIEPLLAPDLISPANGTKSVEPNSKLNWNFKSFYERYRCQVALDTNFAKIVIDNVTSDNYISTGYLASGKKHYWRVLSNNNEQLSEWSDIWSFTTSGTEDVYANSPGGEEINISPNPASDVMTINYKFEDADAVNLRIYNTLGEQILFMPNLNPAGTSRVDISGFYPGNYRLVFEAVGRKVVKTACVCR